LVAHGTAQAVFAATALVRSIFDPDISILISIYFPNHESQPPECNQTWEATTTWVP
jgi:hypothetical protein